jgi:hypothetical protein
MKIEKGKIYAGRFGFYHRRVDDIVNPEGHSEHVFFTKVQYGISFGRGNCTLMYFEKQSMSEVDKNGKKLRKSHA